MQQAYQCSNCGTAVAFGTRFCGNCGVQLNWPAQQQTQKPIDIAVPLAGRNIRLLGDKAFMASAWEIGMAMALIQQDKSSEALQYIDKVLETSQNLSMVWWVKGEALDKLGRLQEAIECFNKAIALDKLNEEALLSRGLTYNKLGDYASALADFTIYLTLSPTSLIGFYHRGMVFFNLGSYELAITIFDQAIKLMGKRENERKKELRQLERETGGKPVVVNVSVTKLYSSLIWTGKAQALIKMGLSKQALTCLKNAVSIQPDSIAWRNLGNLYHSLGNYDEAQRCYDKAGA
jgi:tetratricopeptide (TPR) repeat protein